MGNPTVSPRIRIRVAKPATGGTSALDTAIAGLTAGFGASSFVDMDYTWPGDTGAFLAWFARGHRSTDGKIYWFCKAAGTTGVPYKLFVYDDATNEVTNPYDAVGVITGTGGTQSGHGYDVSALLDDELYVMPVYSEAASKWNGSAFERATGLWPSAISSVRALCGHPNLYGAGIPGLVTAFSSQLRTWRKSGGTGYQWLGLGALGVSPADSQACYAPLFDQVLYTGGTTSPNASWFVTGGATPTFSAAPVGLPVPVHCNSTPINRLVRTPAGTLAILESGQNGTKRAWRMRADASRIWELQSWTHPLAGLNGANGANNFPTTYLADKGVYVALVEQNDGNSKPLFRVWKPPVGF